MQTLKHKSLTWIDFDRTTKEDIQYLHERFNIHPLVLQALGVPSYQPKALQYEHCLFFSIHIPLFDVQERRTYPGELDIILTRDHLITAHRQPIYQIHNFFHELEKSEGKRRLYMEDVPAHLLYRLMEILLNSCFPRLNHISEKLDQIDEQVFIGNEKEMVREISFVKRDILNFRRTLKPQRTIIESIIASKHSFLPTALNPYFQDLVGTNVRLWNMLESDKETIEALEETNNSLLADKLNRTMIVLTIFSAVLLPVTAYTNIMAMNVPLPFAHNPYGLPIHLLIMLTISICTIIIFRWRKWF